MNSVFSTTKKTNAVNGFSYLPVFLCSFSPFLFFMSYRESLFPFFLVNFVAAAVYFFVLLMKKKEKVEEHKKHYTFLLLILFLISAYALNREMQVFAAFPLWFCMVLSVS